ncbi:hypothetical protein CLV84_2998 [Neolewinella xylanilytica]|uniref:Uncharacterized protein n=1 Tax=Neolewinella xylanilytica TaxID=1514080 RepID=A0A2S6I4Q5_9BACT|nr:hypothetical protein [Neolewinella xylanilytica]PPK86081.1 hypothetical protein CLV84_2998 [Neolewinella xylanilytica]
MIDHLSLLCRTSLLLLLVHSAGPLVAGALSVSGPDGTLRYRVEFSDRLMDDWSVLELTGAADELIELFRDERVAWVSLSFYHPVSNKRFFTEVFVGQDNDISVVLDWRLTTDDSQLSVSYERHPATTAQLVYDAFTSTSPANHAIQIADRYGDELNQPDADLHAITFLWVTDQLGYYESTDGREDVDAPYRERMTHRMLHALSGMSHDGDLFSELTQKRKDALVLRAFSSQLPESENAFHGRFWSAYMSLRADVTQQIQATYEAAGSSRQGVDSCSEQAAKIRPTFANLLVYAEYEWFEYLYAAQLQSHLEIFASTPGLFDRELALFHCLFPGSAFTP